MPECSSPHPWASAQGVGEAQNDTIRRLSLNSLSGVFRFIVLTGAYFFTYPYILHSIGSQRFGLWALALVVSQWIVVGDLGIAGSLMKLIPEHWLRRDIRRISQLASTGLFILCCVGVVGVAGIWLLRTVMLQILRIPNDYRQEMLLLIWGMPCVYFLNLVSSGFTAVLNGIQRVDISNALFTAAMGLNAVGIFLFLSHRFGLVGLMANASITAILLLVFNLLAIKRLLPDFQIQVRHLSFADVRGIAGFGVNLQIAAVAGMFLFPIIKVFLSRYVSLAAVSYFELASGMAQQARSLFAMAMLPLVPATAELFAKREFHRISGLHNRSIRVLLISALPACSLAALLSKPFVALWVGKMVPYVAPTLTLLMVGWFVNILALPAYYMVVGMGFPRLQMFCQIVQTGTAALLGLMLVQRFGYYGGVIGLALALCAGAAYIIVQFHRAAPRTLSSSSESTTVRIVLLNIAMTAAAIPILRCLAISGYPKLIATAMVYVAVYALALCFLRCFTDNDIRLAKTLLPGSLGRIVGNGRIKACREAR